MPSKKASRKNLELARRARSGSSAPPAALSAAEEADLSSAFDEWGDQAVDALIALGAHVPPTWAGLPPELAVHVLMHLPLAGVRAVSVCCKEDARRASVAWPHCRPRGWVSSLTQGDYDHATFPLSQHSSLTTHGGLLAIASGTTVLLKAPPAGLPSGLGLSWAPCHEGKIQVGLPRSGPLGVYKYPSVLYEQPNKILGPMGDLRPNRVLHCESIALSKTRVAIKLSDQAWPDYTGGYFVWCVWHLDATPHRHPASKRAHSISTHTRSAHTLCQSPQYI